MNLNLQNILSSTLTGFMSTFFAPASKDSQLQEIPYLYSGSNVICADGIDPQKLEIIEEGNLLIIQGSQFKENQLFNFRKVYQFRNLNQQIKNIEICGKDLVVII